MLIQLLYKISERMRNAHAIRPRRRQEKDSKRWKSKRSGGDEEQKNELFPSHVINMWINNLEQAGSQVIVKVCELTRLTSNTG